MLVHEEGSGDDREALDFDIFPDLLVEVGGFPSKPPGKMGERTWVSGLTPRYNAMAALKRG